MNFIRLYRLILIFSFYNHALYGLVNYASQHCSMQDKYLHETFFKDKRNGFFVDIGAHDGVAYSNSYFFEKALDWTGICIEPIAAEFEKLKTNRACICLNTCVSHKDGTLPFLLVDNFKTYDQYFNANMLSGLLETYGEAGLNRLHAELAGYGVSYSIVQMPSRRLQSILTDHHVTHIDYLSIDTEGCELEILKTIDFNQVTIDVMTIENNYGRPEVRNFLEMHGFRLFKNLGQDEVFVRNDFKF